MAICGIVAPILFTLMVILESLLRPGYSQTYNFVSDLGVGPNAILQNINFVVFGILVIGLAIGLLTSKYAPRSLAFKAGIVFMVIFALGVGLAGVYPENYGDGKMHTLVSSTAFLAVIIAQILIGWGLWKGDKAVWGGYRIYSVLGGILALLVLFLVFQPAMNGDFRGLAQRIFLAVPWIWVEVTGLKLYSVANSA